MSDIVWAINPNYDRLEDLSQRMRRFASDMLSARDITLRFATPGNLSARLAPNLRRQVFLIFKESVNNLVSHSSCTETEIELGLNHDKLWLRVCDNGKGFDMTKVEAGHGVVNMQRRAALIGGRIDVISCPDHGTAIELNVGLNPRLSTPAEAANHRLLSK